MFMYFVLFKDTETTEIYTDGHTLSIHDALPSSLARRIAADHRATRDLGPDSLRTALVELLVELPAYRSYADAQGCGAADADMLAGAAERDRKSTRLNSSH